MKALIIRPAPKRTKELLALSRKNIRIVTGLLTGHRRVLKHLKVMGVSQTDRCRICNEEDETAEHILCYCEGLCRTRRLHLGEAYLKPQNIVDKSPKEIAVFIGRTILAKDL